MAGDVCSKCGAAVMLVITAGSLIRKLDPEPRPGGNHIITQIDGKMRATVLTGAEMPAQQEAFKVHVCEQVDRPGPPCTVCRRPMHRELATTLRWTTHPGCDASDHIEELRRRVR
jgi:hypothetical protein